MKKLFLFLFIFFSLFIIFTSKIEAACVWNQRQSRCIGTCTYGSCRFYDFGVCGCYCGPSCSCSQFFCQGTTCPNGCGGTCPGSKICATPTPAPYCSTYLYNPSFCPCGCTPTSSGGTCSSCCLSSRCPCGCTSSSPSGGNCKACPTSTPSGPHCTEEGLCSDPSRQSLGGAGSCGFNCSPSERQYAVLCLTSQGNIQCGVTCIISSSCTVGGCLGGETPVPTVPPFCPSGSAYCLPSTSGNNECGGCTGSSCCSSCRRLLGRRYCYDQNNPSGHWTAECGETDPTCPGSCGGGTPGPSGAPTPTPTPAPDEPTCTIAGPNTLTVGEDGTYRTISTSYSGGDANAEIMINSAQSITGATRLGYSDCGGTAETCELNNVVFTPSAVGTYYVFCRGFNDGVKECRPFPPYDAPSTHDVDCDPDSTPDDPPAGSDFITVTVAQPGPWWQVKDSDVTAMGGLTSTISPVCTLPGCNPFFDLEGDGGFPGIPLFSGTTNLTASDVSSKGWLVNSTLVSNKTYDYAYFSRLIPSDIALAFNEITSSSIEGTVLSSTGTAYNGVYWFHYDGETSGLDLEITSNVALGNRKVVLMVEGGNLNVRGEISLTDSSGFFIALVGENSTGAKGGINIDPTVGGSADGVPELEGLYLADGAFHTGAGTTQLHVRGSVASLGGMYLERDLPDDNQTPAEYFEYAPDQIMLLPTKLQVKKYKWKEVAP